MPCMCGDTYCYSCGPAQGNSQCDVCGEWSADGGCSNPEKCIEDSNEQQKYLADMFQWEKDNADAIAKAIRSK